MSEEFVYGTPSYEESNRVWKRFPGESDVSDVEYEEAANSLVKHISRKYKLYGFRVDGDLYVRGDFYGDRTHYVELCLPELLSPEFISYLQAWLSFYDNGSYRILIPTYVGDDATIFVYPEVVRLGARWEADLPAAWVAIAKMMRDRDKDGTYKKRLLPLPPEPPASDLK